MKLLLDTHAFIWWFSAAHLLSNDALAAIQDSSNSLHLSAASVWEIQIKTQLGKLTFAYPLQVIIEHQKQANNLRILNIEPAHIYALDNLPLHHKDPFDRLISRNQLSNV